MVRTSDFGSGNPRSNRGRATTIGDEAQEVEQWTVNPMVVGSNPAIPAPKIGSSCT